MPAKSNRWCNIIRHSSWTSRWRNDWRIKGPKSGPTLTHFSRNVRGPYAEISREWTIIGSVSYRNRYWVYRIESYQLLLYWPILHASLQVHQLLTDRITHDDQRAFKRPVTRPRARTHMCCFMVHDTGEGWRGGRWKEIVTWYRHPRDTKTAQYWSWPPSCRTPSTSRKW